MSGERGHKSELEMAQSHFRNAQEDIKKAQEIIAKMSEQREEHGRIYPIPHPNPELRNPKQQARDYLYQALNSLDYAKELGVDYDQIEPIQESIMALLKELDIPE